MYAIILINIVYNTQNLQKDGLLEIKNYKFIKQIKRIMFEMCLQSAPFY